MTSRLIRALIDDDCHVTVSDRASALAHFRNVIEQAWANPSPATALPKRQLDYFCGHIDPMPGLRDFIPVPVVAQHFTSLHGDVAGDATAFQSSLLMYLSLLNTEVHPDHSPVAFRGASVALTFDRARHEANISRFAPDEPKLRHEMRRGIAHER